MKNDNLFDRLTSSVRSNKKVLSIMLLAAMAVSVIGGVLPSIEGLADNGGPYTNHNVGDGPGVISLTSISGEKKPISQTGTGTLEEDADTPKRLLNGAEFTVSSLDEIVGEETINSDINIRMVTDVSGEFKLTGLPVGKYSVKEVVAPTGFEILEKDTLDVEITDEHPKAHLTFQNRELEVSPVISKEWTEGSESVNYNIDYEYYGVDGKLVEESDVLFSTDTIEVGDVMYYTPEGEVNKVNITKYKVDSKNHNQYEYELVEDTHDVKILGDQIKRHIEVKKDFDGQVAKNVDVELVELEENVDIEDSNKVVGKITLSEKNNWAHTFKDMPRYTENQLTGSIADRIGEHIEYGVRAIDYESDADGYASVVEGNEIDSFITFNHELKDIEVVIDKVWIGTKGNKSKFEVKVNGEVWETVSMTSKDEWSKTVPLKQVPYDAEVTVGEIEVDEGYDINVIEEENNKFVVEGVERLGSLEILMNKGAKDPRVSTVNVDRKEVNVFSMTNMDSKDVSEDSTEKASPDIESTRLAGAKFLVESKELKEDKEGNKVSAYSKEVTTNKDGLAVLADIPFGEYTITEVESPEGYKIGEIKSVDLTVDGNQTRRKYRADFYNERSDIKSQSLNIKVTKKWEFEEGISKFKVPEKVTMKLVSKLPNGEVHEESDAFVLNDANKWTKEFTDMPNVNNTKENKPLDYTVVEINDSDVTYSLEVTLTGSYFNNLGNEVDIFATNVERVGRVDVVKVEGSNKPTTVSELDKNVKMIDGAKFELRDKKSNKVVREGVTAKGGKLTMVNLPYGEYTLTETKAPEGYSLHETKSVNLKIFQPQSRDKVVVKFENEKIDKNVTSVKVATEWRDSKGRNLDLNKVGIRDIKVQLYRNDIKQDSLLTLNARNKWKASFDNLKVYEDGKDTKYKYTVKEVISRGSALDTGYKTELKGNAKDGYVIVNTQIDSKRIDIPVVKKWVGNSKELDKVTLQLRNYDKVVDEITLTARDRWRGTFEDVPLMENNNQDKVRYRVVELDHRDYYSKVYGNSDDSGYEVRNTEKTEDEKNNPMEKRDIDVKMNMMSNMPKEVSVELFADGRFENSVKLSENNDYKYTFKDLYVYKRNDNKSEIKYTIGEVKADGYVLTVKGNMKDGFTITANVRADEINKDKDKVEKITLREVYEEITGCTSYEDVKKLMGRDGIEGKFDGVINHNWEHDGGDDFYHWTEGEDYLEIGFINNLASSKAVSDSVGFSGTSGMTCDKEGPIIENPTIVDPKDDGKDNTFGGNPNEEDGPIIEDSIAGQPQGEEGVKTAEDGFKQTATSALGLGLFALAGVAGVGAVAYKKKKED